MNQDAADTLLTIDGKGREAKRKALDLLLQENSEHLRGLLLKAKIYVDTECGDDDPLVLAIKDALK